MYVSACTKYACKFMSTYVNIDLYLILLIVTMIRSLKEKVQSLEKNLVNN